MMSWNNKNSSGRQDFTLTQVVKEKVQAEQHEAHEHHKAEDAERRQVHGGFFSGHPCITHLLPPYAWLTHPLTQVPGRAGHSLVDQVQTHYMDALSFDAGFGYTYDTSTNSSYIQI